MSLLVENNLTYLQYNVVVLWREEVVSLLPYNVMEHGYSCIYHFHTSDQRVKPVHISYIALVLEC